MRPWLHLARISNLPTVWTNVTAAWLLAGGKIENLTLIWLILAGSLLYTGGMILNDAADVAFDRQHRKERPIPRGAVTVRKAWNVGSGMLVVGFAIACVAGAHVWITLGLVVAILFYDLYHKPWAGSVIVMGACRALLYLMAASAVPSVAPTVGGMNLVVLPYAVALGCYVVGITLAARLESKGGELPIASALLSFALLYLPAVLCARRFAIGLGDPWQLGILAVFAALVGYATQHMRRGGPAIGKAVGLLLAGIVVVDALAISVISLPLAVVFVVLAPLLLVWQRWVAAT